MFKNTIEAKTAIANWLGFPLGRLMPKQIEKINEIVAESLDKKVVMAKIKQLFALKLIKFAPNHTNLKKLYYLLLAILILLFNPSIKPLFFYF